MQTVGERLRAARERSNRSIRELSEQTKIRSDHLEALESGRYEVFSAPVYIRGFVRSYASALKLDPSETLAALEEELKRLERFKEPPPLTRESRGMVDRLMLVLSKVNWTVALPLIALALILLAAVIGYRIYQRAAARDPFKELGPGLYQPPLSGETLPLPVSTNE